MEKHPKRFIVYWAPVIAWMATIFFLSSRQSVTVSPEYLWNFLFFKTLHLIEYAILFVLVTRAVHNTVRVAGSRIYKYAFAVTILYAMTDELHQQFVPTREGRVRDVIIDGIGAMLVWYFLLRRLPKAPKLLKRLVRKLELPT